MQLLRRRYTHLKQQGRCVLHKREPPEGEEDTFEPTEEEQEEGPEPLTSLESDSPVDSDSAWSPLYSSSNENVKNQVGLPLLLQHPVCSE
jgi:hypothetical protein